MSDLTAPIEAFLSRYGDLPHELQHALLASPLDLPAIAASALDSEWTSRLLIYLEPLFPDICARWNQRDRSSQILAAYGRIVPLAPYLSEYAITFFRRHGTLLEDIWTFQSESDIAEALLGVLRLLIYDLTTFASFIRLDVLLQGLQHQNRSIRYLVIRSAGIFLRAVDSSQQELIVKYLGTEPVYGKWDGKDIDYAFLSLWEERRWADVQDERTALLSSLTGCESSSPFKCQFREQDLSPSTASIFGSIMPLSQGPAPAQVDQNLVPTETTLENVQKFTSALRKDAPILLTGLSGSGKTSLVSHCASVLDRATSMVTLHLNEQSDAKMLVGMYTSGAKPGTFEWRPGVLTTAVKEGRWLFIEDLDRAPNEIISVLLPLIERRELLIPSRGQSLKASQGFRIIATMRTTLDLAGREQLPRRQMIGSRLWSRVDIKSAPLSELCSMIVHRYSALSDHVERLIAVYDALQKLSHGRQSGLLLKNGSARPLSPRDLFKWGLRLNRQFTHVSSFSDADLDFMFMEAVDCFVGHLPAGELAELYASVIAEHLHIDVDRKDFLSHDRPIRFADKNSEVVIGRVGLPKTIAHSKNSTHSAFALSPHSLRLLEKLASAVRQQEPLLLVGETGIGKTTCIQHLAERVGQKLLSFNLSQQSESGDLIGGFKPVNIRGLIMPMREDFEELFHHPLSPFATQNANSKKDTNQQFIGMLGKAIAKSQWKKVCHMWKTAAEEVQKNFGKPVTVESPRSSPSRPSKRRRISSHVANGDGASQDSYQARWTKFLLDVRELESHLMSRSAAFAFKFVEGQLVKAVRNGHWVLLDEINLSTPDTLEAIVDLLGGDSGSTPSVLLTESGAIERVEAHPDFRVFAAMNPATDIGKKDLPLGIRSRFTEFYVDSPDRDHKSLRQIVSSYLPEELGPRIVADTTNLYTDIQRLAESNSLVDGAGQKPHFSLRTLTRTLAYARDVASQVGAKDAIYRRALYEGFHMSFLTLLNNDSEALVAPKVSQAMFGQHANSKAELNKALPKPSDGRKYVQERHYWLRQGMYPPEEQPHYIITNFVRRNLDNLIRAISTHKLPILIQGPTSSGKTSMIEYLAKKSGNRFVRINNHEHTDLQEYLGTYVSGADGQLRFQEGVLVEALRKGYWIVLDELNLAPTDVLEALNRLLDDNRELLIPETQEIIRPHPDFMLFATQNPAGLYGGRKHLSRAFRNRFLELHFDDIPVTELREILQQRTQIPPSWAERIVNVYKELSSLRQEQRMFEQKSFATLRDLFRWALRKADDTQQLAVNGYMLLAERVRKPEEREKVKSIIEEVMSRRGPRIRIDEEQLYSATTSPHIAAHQAQSQSDAAVVWTKSMRRLYVLVANAIANNEPVLLVGETGCGKTTVCQMLARTLSKELLVLNAHQNTETGDLIGSQRPLRNRSAVDDALRTLLRQVIPGAKPSQTLNELIEAYDTLLHSDAASVDSSTKQDISLLRVKSKALFEWSDGILVRAMRTGQLFLLDEISLADDSVLERMNSVLEPSRTVLLAEKGPSDDAFVTASDGFQFLATMNPGGDYGKRELSPALRNRFTEIWVPSLYDQTDVLEIVQAKLVPSAQHHAQALVQFSSWFNRLYNSSATSTISIRDTLAWLEFINRFSDNVDLAVLHGAAMVYIDTLGANPAAMLSISSAAVDIERKRCIENLSQLINANLDLEFFSVPQLTIADGTVSIGSFKLVSKATEANRYQFSFNAQTTRSNAMRVFRALQLTKPLLIEGNPGVGKTTLVTAIAEVVGKHLVRINLSEQTDLMDLFGSDVPVEGGAIGTFTWRDAPFLSAMKNGDWVLLDEMNLASQSVLEGLNACLDHRAEAYIAELDQTFHRHPNFRLFAAQNPHHQGGGRKGLPASFVNRFTVVYADVLKQADLQVICKESFPNAEADNIVALTRFVDMLESDVSVRRKFGSLGSPWEFNLRDALRWLQLLTREQSLVSTGDSYDFCDLIFRQRFRNADDRKQLDHLFSAAFDTKPTHRSFYHNLAIDSMQVGLGLLPRETITGTSQVLPAFPVGHLSALECLVVCVELNWPVLLIGASGAGKTRMLNYLASMTGRSLVTFSMNGDIDAMDLVGGFEQADPSRSRSELVLQISSSLRKLIVQATSENPDIALQLAQAIPKGFWNHEVSSQDASMLVTVLESTKAPIFKEVLHLLKRLLSIPEHIEKAQFEWIDGLLIRAMQNGDWLVLDNANLCSSSVLDRLNSLLEPNGSLSINEHPIESGEPRIVRPHADFRIFFTMDPRHGELSRAMRNRSIEIYLPHTDDSYTSRQASTFASESSLYRYRAILSCKDASAVEYAVDHLSFRDFDMHTRFIQQMHQGLVREAEVRELAAEKIGDLYQWVKTGQHHNVNLSLKLLTDGGKQSIQPLNNEIIVRRHGAPHSIHAAQVLELRLDLLGMTKALSAATARALQARPVTAFERSLRQRTVQGSGLEDTVKVAPFLKASLSAIEETVGQLSQHRTEHVGAASLHEPHHLHPQTSLIQALVGACELWWTLFKAVTASPLELARYHIIVELGRRLFLNGSESESLVADFINKKHQLITQMSSGTALTSGLHMEVLWKAFRPSTVGTRERLATLQIAEELSDKFDAAVFPLRATVEDLCGMRMGLQNAIRLCYAEDASVESLIEEIKPAIDELSQEHGQSPSQAILQKESEGLLQILECQSIGALPLANLSRLALLAGRPTRRMRHDENSDMRLESLRSTMRELALVANSTMTQETPSAALGGLQVSMTKRLQELGQIPLGQMDQLRIETLVLSKSLAAHAQMLEVDQYLRLGNLMSSHVQHWNQTLVDDANTKRTLDGVSLHSSNSTATNLVEYALYCLSAYIPDRAFDPALKESMQQELVREKRAKYEDKIKALQTFERGYTGQETSLRIRLAEEELRELGQDLPKLEIVRPEQSQLNDLQSDFNRILQITSSIRVLMKGAVREAVTSSMQNVKLLIERLDRNYPAYRDLTGPAIQWLQCLWLGLSLLGRDRAPQADGLCLSSMGLMNKLANSAPVDDDLNSQSFDQMQLVALSRRLNGADTLRDLARRFFQDMYVAWKDQMGIERSKQAKKSSLYVFRGDQEEQDNIDDEDYQELFPTYDDEEEAGTERHKHEDNLTRGTAVHIADTYERVYSLAFDPTIAMLDIIQKSDSDQQDMSSALPGLLLGFQRQIRNLSSQTSCTDQYNVYTDANIPEATRLAALVIQIIHRFKALQAMEFEHATVDDVVHMATDIMDYPHTEPLIKMLVKVEKLYTAMYEWEKIAHKGLSAKALLDEMTSLIVSWRRLELSTWMQLFVIEQRKAEDDAKSWWFVAYENIVANPQRLSAEHLKLHTPELLRALEAFFLSATLGQFSQRLNILSQFQRQIRSVDGSMSQLKPIADALDNFIAYFLRFKVPVAESLAQQRQQLEKQAKEIVQLASWRDVNIEALRQSAQISHRKLFRLVRKFRAILNKPIASIIEAGPPDGEPNRSNLLHETRPQEFELKTITTIVETIPSWQNLPPRFKNTGTTIELMTRLGAVSERIDGPQYIEDFLTSLKESISELQKATPSLLTEENKEIVKHLKTRKRTLFAEVLKSLRRMGFQYNINSSILEKQGSVATVLAGVPPLPASHPSSQSEALDFHFHKLLSFVTKVRAITREHHGDLTPAEVQRSSGYVEGVLHQVLLQRQTLYPFIEYLTAVRQLSSRAFGLWDRERQIPLQQSAQSRMNDLPFVRRRLSWLGPILEVFITLHQAQIELGDLSGKDTIAMLQDRLQCVKDMKEQVSALPSLPADLSITVHDDICVAFGNFVIETVSRMDNAVAKEPAFGPLLNQLKQWFPESASTRVPGEDFQSSDLGEGVFTKTLACADGLLASVQSLRMIAQDLPSSHESTNWLPQHSRYLKESITALQPVATIGHVQEVFASLSQENNSQAIPFVLMLQPLLQQYADILANHVSAFVDLYITTCKLGHHLSCSFLEIGTKGFCTPPDKTGGEGDAEQDQKLEGGTGLGDGEGAEDISKDIGDDEDLTELAQEPNEKKEGDELEDEKDAVDMADEDMEGELGETADKGDDHGDDSGDGQEDNVEDEMGSVDDLGAEAVDEKMWDEGGVDDSKKEKQTDKSKGTKNEEQMAAEAKQSDQQDRSDEEEEEAQEGAHEDENVGQDQGEKVDDYTEEANNLDLPDDINLDGDMNDKSDNESMDDLDDLEGEAEQPQQEIDEQQDTASEAGQDEPELKDGGEAEEAEVDVDEAEQGATNDEQHEEELQQEIEDDVMDEDRDADLAPEGDNRDVDTAEDAINSGVQGMDANEQDDESTSNSRAKQEAGQEGDANDEQSGAKGEKGTEIDPSKQDAVGRSEDLVESTSHQPFKKLGDALEKWFNQNRQIQQPSKDDDATKENKRDVDMADADFEHLLDEESKAEAQALGTASEEQARALNEDNAVASNEHELPQKSFVEDEDQAQTEVEQDEDIEMRGTDSSAEASNLDQGEQPAQAKAFVGDSTTQRDTDLVDNMEDDIDDNDQVDVPSPSADNITDSLSTIALSTAQARALWSEHEARTRPLAATLTEQLRLILAPTMATKLRGDFRTGKRLNIKRIIPYIASSYKRDKIWMRRSTPSKRAYQIMLAVDDSESMAEHGKKELAFETLALVSKALAMLEVGELCVAGFGEKVSVVHPFDKPFTDDAGVSVFENLSFDQGDTDVRRLVSDGIALFQEARARASSSAQDLWQLMLVLSDAICRDADSIRRLVRRAEEEKIMIVFVVIDSGAREVDGRAVGSIMDLQGAEFEDGKVKMYRYMDVFPFRWWVVVRDVKELPGVLSMALRQWFAEVVESGG